MGAYEARNLVVDGVDVVRLTDARARVAVSIAPSVGDIAYDMTVGGKPILLRPRGDLASWSASPTHAGIPLLAPWAARLARDGFWFGGKDHRWSSARADFSRDREGRPNQGLVAFAGWRLIETRADDAGAEATSRLDFGRPEWLEAFPFAHVYELTHRVADGALEVRLAIENRSAEPMPVFVGFHPWLRIPFSSRETWRLHLPACERWALSPTLLPDGSRTRAAASELPLAGRELDDVLGAIAEGDEIAVEGAGARIAVRAGPRYTVAVVYAPRAGNVICIEPMTAIPNALDLAHAGAYAGLQTLEPGARWVESFWIRATGL